MNYTETDLTEATKIRAYLRSIQRYAIAILFLSIVYFGFRFHNNLEKNELYLFSFFTSIVIIGSLSIVIRLNHKTAMIYGFSCIVTGIMFLFSLVYYRNTTPDFFTTIGFIIGLIVIRHGVSLVFGKRSQEIFSRANQNKISFVNNLIKSMKQSIPSEKNIIHCMYSDDGKMRKMKIAFFDDIACFLLTGQRTPMFFDRGNIFIFELQYSSDLFHVSIVADNHDWLEADLKSDDFKKYQAWKDL